MTAYRDMTVEQRSAKAQQVRQWKLDNRDRVRTIDRRAHLKRRYGITPEAYDGLYASQNGKCAVCGVPRATLDVDHDHSTGEIRGLLCHRCNWAIGILGDSPEKAYAVVEYFARNFGGRK